ncbi:MAG TPA: ATP-binding protein [Myxococcales bacterium]|nr:ATP-binding protein [Myxococcales bacterium]
MGLAIVQRIAQGHGGSVSLVEEGRGATFEVFLPATA